MPDQEPLAPHPTLRSFYPADDQRQSFVNDLFDRTARYYDWMNSVMSFGSGYWYRGEVLREAGLKPGMRVLDVATGTGPVAVAARAIVGESGTVIGIDPSSGMLQVAHEKANVAPASAGGTHFVQAVGEALPVSDDRFDLLSMGYALRHVPDLRATFREYHRVLKTGGRLVIMEIAVPESKIVRAFLRWYMGSILPVVARLGTRNRDAERMMRYYWETTMSSISAERILASLEEAGFARVWSTTRFGLLRDYHAVK